MGTPIQLLVAVTTLVACISLGGALYEALVVDPYWPKRPGIVQSHNGGISRVRFWLPVYTLFEVLLVVTLVLTRGDADVGGLLLVAVVSHAVMRIWSVFDLIPKAAQFERKDPADVDEAAAVRWTRRSLFRLPLSLATCTPKSLRPARCVGNARAGRPAAARRAPTAAGVTRRRWWPTAGG